MAEAYICDFVRTPIGRYGGALKDVRPDDMLAHVFRVLKERNAAVDWDAVDDCYVGCANQAGEDNRDVARMATLLAGLPVSIPGATLNRLCGSGLDAVGTAARMIRSGDANIVLAGGVESMTRAPFVVGKATDAFSRQADMFDTTIGWRFVNPMMRKTFGTDSMPETGENVAAQFDISRQDQDGFAWRSQQRTGLAQAAGFFAREIAPVTVSTRKGDKVVAVDEHPRAETTLEDLARLRTPFRDPGTVTAGNASGVNDGAAALILASEEAARRHGLTPRARVVAMAAAGVEPRIMGIGPAPRDQEAARPAGSEPERYRFDRAQRSLRQPGAGGHEAARPRRRLRSCQSSRRGHRPRTSARDVGRAPGSHERQRARDARLQASDRDHVHRRGPGHRRAD